MFYIVEVFNWEKRIWDTMDYTDYETDGKKKKAIFNNKRKAQRLRDIAHIFTGGARNSKVIKTRIVTTSN